MYLVILIDKRDVLDISIKTVAMFYYKVDAYDYAEHQNLLEKEVDGNSYHVVSLMQAGAGYDEEEEEEEEEPSPIVGKYRLKEEIIKREELPNTYPEQCKHDLYTLAFEGQYLMDVEGEEGENLVLKNPRTGELFFTQNIDWE